MDLTELCTLAQYREAGRQHIFPSPTSLEWTCRRLRAELVREGALLVINGRRMIDPPVFDRVILAAARRAAQLAMADEDGAS